MFEVGERYTIVTGLGDEEGSSGFTVLEWSPPLLRVIDGVPRETIFNTTSPSFVRAEKARERRASVYPSAGTVAHEGNPSLLAGSDMGRGIAYADDGSILGGDIGRT